MQPESFEPSETELRTRNRNPRRVSHTASSLEGVFMELTGRRLEEGEEYGATILVVPYLLTTSSLGGRIYKEVACA